MPLGVPAPDLELEGLDGRRWSLSSLLADAHPLLLVFSEAGCVACDALLPDLAGWQREYRDRLTIAVIARGERDRNERAAREHGLDLLVLGEHAEQAAAAYRAHGTPMAVLVAPDAMIASQTVAGVGAITTLIAQATRPVPDTTARIGEPAPALILDDLAGNPVPLADLYVEPIVALFWSPTCAYSRQMLPILHAFEQDPPAAAPRVVVISGGDPRKLREQAIRLTVLLDPEGHAMRAFEAPGTPMAVLVRDGRIASDIHAGAGAVLELITTAPATAG
jgi:peroxiredoxin